MTNSVHVVSQDVSSTIPDPLIHYLWTLSDEALPVANHVFFLTRSFLSGKPVQTVLHVTENGFEESHKLFGFAPVNSVVRVCCRDGELMEMVGPLEAAGNVQTAYNG